MSVNSELPGINYNNLATDGSVVGLEPKTLFIFPENSRVTSIRVNEPRLHFKRHACASK